MGNSFSCYNCKINEQMFIGEKADHVASRFLEKFKTDSEVVCPPKLTLSDTNKRLLLDNWTQILKNLTFPGQDRDATLCTLGMRVFNIMMLRPEIRQVFPFGHLPSAVMQQDIMFKAHAIRFAQVVAIVVDDLRSNSLNSRQETEKNNQVWKIGQFLQSIGHIHASYPKLSLWIFKDAAEQSALSAMLQAWKESQDSGDAWTVPVASAWESLFKQIIHQVYVGFFLAWLQKHPDDHMFSRSDGLAKIAPLVFSISHLHNPASNM